MKCGVIFCPLFLWIFYLPEKEVTWEFENSQVPNYPMNRTLSSPGTNLTSSPEDRENIADLLYFVKRNKKNYQFFPCSGAGFGRVVSIAGGPAYFLSTLVSSLTMLS